MVAETGYESVIEAYEQNFFNPLCFLQYYDSSISPSEFSNGKVHIYNIIIHYIYVCVYIYNY